MKGRRRRGRGRERTKKCMNHLLGFRDEKVLRDVAFRDHLSRQENKTTV